MSPSTANPDHSHYDRLKEQLRQRLRQGPFDAALAAKVRSTYRSLLEQEPIVLTRNEKEQVIREVLQELVDEILAGDGWLA